MPVKSIKIQDIAPEIVGEIINFYTKEKFTIKELATKFGFKAHLINKILVANNVPWNKKYLKDLTVEQEEKIINAFDNGETVKEIAKELQISSPAISKFLKKHGKEIIATNNKYDHLRAKSFSRLQKEAIVGTLLGDGCLYQFNDKGNYRLSFGHCEKQKELVDHMVKILDPFIIYHKRVVDKRGNSIMWNASTCTHPDLDEFGKCFYPGLKNHNDERLKVVPDLAKEYLTPFSLAIWLMDDGNLHENVNNKIFTLSFSLEENEKLIGWLKELFDIEAYTQQVFKKVNEETRGYYELRFDKHNSQKLADIVRPFTIPSMQYKLINEENYDQNIMTPEKIKDIRAMKDAKMKNMDIADKYGIKSRNTITNIWKRKSWTKVK